MHYKRISIVETVVFDGEVLELPEIKKLVTDLKNCEFDVSLHMKNEVVMHPKVRIIDVADDYFKYIIIGKGSSLVKKSGYSDIEKMIVIGNDLYVSNNKPNQNRWSMLNPVEDLDKEIKHE